jgi:hypothetical protein
MVSLVNTDRRSQQADMISTTGRLFSREAWDKIASRDRKWLVDFNGRAAVKSVKNVVMVNIDDKIVILVVKLDKDTVGVKVRPEMSFTAAFCFGISCFVNNL